MKKELFHSLKKKNGLIFILFMLLLSSCTDGFKDESSFSSSVTNTQLESPDPAQIKVSTVTGSTGAPELKIEWPVIHGAGGYEFTLYNVDDPNSPIAVGEEKQIIDGSSAQRARADDTRYKIVVKTLGNKVLNNTDAAQAAETDYTTLIDVYASIPSGSDLGDYFKANPVPEPKADVPEVVYELEANGVYTMKSDVALKSTNVTLRGDKLYHPQIKVSGNSSFISDGAGFKIRWMDIDMDGYDGEGFIQYNTTINEENAIFYEGNPWIVVEASSGIESCKITNLKTPIISDRGKKYALRNFTFNDCIVEQHAASSKPFVNFTGAIIKDLIMTNSTFYNHNKDYGSAWIVYANVRTIQVADRQVWANETGVINIQNSTFWQISYKKHFFNSNGWAQKYNSVNLQNSIFVDTGNKEILRRIRMSSINVEATLLNNTYWYDGAFPDNEVEDGRGDKTGTHIASDPKFKDPANGDFTVGGSAQIAARTGDPRWLPEAQ